MKIALHITVEVDPDAWALEYGIPRKQVREDVRSYVENALTLFPVPLLPVAPAPRQVGPSVYMAPATPPAPAAADSPTPRVGAGGTPVRPEQLGRSGRTTTTPPALTPRAAQDARRGGEVRAVQPPPAAAVLAGAESRPDSGPTTLPAHQERPGCRTAAGHPGPHRVTPTAQAVTAAAPVLRAAAPPPPAPVPAGPVRRRARLAPALIAAAVTAVVMLVAGAPGAELPPGTVPAPAPVVATRDRHPYNPDHGGVRASRRRAVANRTAVGPDPVPRRRACGLLALSLVSVVTGLTLLAGAASAAVLTWWAG